MMTALLAALLGIGLLILVHEWGHFGVAKRLGLTVQEFSIGLGPPLLRWRGKDGIVYHLRLFFLFGGFVRIQEIEQDLLQKPSSLAARPARELGRRIAVIASGPATNIVLAVFLLFLYSLWDVGLRSTTEIAAVAAGSPAAQAGLQAGDEIVGFAHLRPKVPDSKTFKQELLCYISSHPRKPIRLWVRRDFQEFPVTLIPNRRTVYYLTDAPDKKSWGLKRWLQRRLGRVERKEVGVIGIAFRREPVVGGMSLLERVRLALPWTVVLLSDAAKQVVLPLTQPLLLREVSGPIRIVYEVVATRWQGVMEQVRLFAVLNVVIALVNLFPLPILDGGRILFLVLELLCRRRIHRLEVTATYLGFFFLLALFLFITVKDLHFLLSRP